MSSHRSSDSVPRQSRYWKIFAFRGSSSIVVLVICKIQARVGQDRHPKHSQRCHQASINRSESHSFVPTDQQVLYCHVECIY